MAITQGVDTYPTPESRGFHAGTSLKCVLSKCRSVCLIFWPRCIAMREIVQYIGPDNLRCRCPVDGNNFRYRCITPAIICFEDSQAMAHPIEWNLHRHMPLSIRTDSRFDMPLLALSRNAPYDRHAKLSRRIKLINTNGARGQTTTSDCTSSPTALDEISKSSGVHDGFLGLLSHDEVEASARCSYDHPNAIQGTNRTSLGPPSYIQQIYKRFSTTNGLPPDRKGFTQLQFPTISVVSHGNRLERARYEKKPPRPKPEPHPTDTGTKLLSTDQVSY